MVPPWQSSSNSPKERPTAGCRVKFTLMIKEQFQTQVWVEQSCHEARTPTSYTPCMLPQLSPRTSPLGEQKGQKGSLGPRHQHAEVHLDPQGS